MPITSKTGGRLRLPYLPVNAAIGFFIAVVMVLVIAGLSNATLQSTATARAGVTHAMAVLDRLQGTLSAIQDAESAQRGFLLTGNESYLEPYVDAQPAIQGLLAGLRPLVETAPDQLQRVDTLTELALQKMAELEETIALQRSGSSAAALTLVRTGRGKALMDRIRVTGEEIAAGERAALEQSQVARDAAAAQSLQVTIVGSAMLLALILASAIVTSRSYRSRETEVWLRSGHAELAERMQGDLRVEVLGERVLSFLTDYLGAPVGAVYVAERSGTVVRVASHGLPPAAAGDAALESKGLLQQVVKAGRSLHVSDVPSGHLPITSAVGESRPRELLIVPALADDAVYGVIELGFLHKVKPHDEALMGRAAELLGLTVRGARDRSRLEELLEETQRQSAELQAQQEELRVNNEELEEQSRALQESQARLETQQAELEQTNTHLEEQAETMRTQAESIERARASLAEKAGELERVNQYKSEFLANMSHELRTPLNSTLILAKLLADNKDGNLTPEQVRYAQTISSAGNDLLALINDVLDLAKVEAGKLDIVPESVNVLSVTDGLAKTFAPLADQKGLKFTAEVETGVPAMIETDTQRLGQILKNLVSNGLKFTPRGEVHLTVSSRGGQVAFAVRDTGIGIDVDQQEVIFEAFRQADGSTHRKYGGTGLGLSISRDLARLLGGTLDVSSTPGAGSTFTLTLPVRYVPPVTPAAAERAAALPSPAAAPIIDRVTTAATPTRAAAAPVARRSGGVEDDRDHLDDASRLILIIEDDERFALVLRDLAREQGFRCVIGHTAGEGLELANAYKPHAILLDVNLPDHSGLGVLDQLKRNPKTRHIPVHVASVADFSHEALELGAIGYAVKPVKREEVIDALERLNAKATQGVQRVLVVEDDPRQRESVAQLLAAPNVEIVGADTAAAALKALEAATFDCLVLDLHLPDLSGFDLLQAMAEQESIAFPPVIVYTGRSLSRDEEQRLRRYSRSIIVKDARSPERLLDEVTLFLHQVEATLPAERQRMLKVARDRDTVLDGKRILIVEDDVRNVFALSSVLEPKGVRVEIARNGREALDLLARTQGSETNPVDLVLMDIMMPEMDGFTAMREIRLRPEWRRLPIIALTAKAMRDDQEKCLAAGANDYIAKPLDVEKLLSLVRVWMPR